MIQRNPISAVYIISVCAKLDSTKRYPTCGQSSTLIYGSIDHFQFPSKWGSYGCKPRNDCIYLLPCVNKLLQVRSLNRLSHMLNSINMALIKIHAMEQYKPPAPTDSGRKHSAFMECSLKFYSVQTVKTSRLPVGSSESNLSRCVLQTVIREYLDGVSHVVKQSILTGKT